MAVTVEWTELLDTYEEPTWYRTVCSLTKLDNGVLLGGCVSKYRILRSTDDGITWVPSEEELMGIDHVITSFAEIGGGTVLLGTAKNNPYKAKVAKSTDYGANWAFLAYPFTDPPQDLQFSYHLTYLGSGHFVINSHDYAGKSSAIATSSDYGESWTGHGHFSDRQSEIPCIFINLGSGTVLMATNQDTAGEYGRVYKSTDWGESWSLVSSLHTSWHGFKAMVHLGEGILIASGYDKLYRSTDYGENWTEVLSGIAWPKLLHLGGGWVISNTTHNIKLILSTDYGENWTVLEPQQPKSMIAIPSFIYLGGGTILASTTENTRGGIWKAQLSDWPKPPGPPTGLLCEQKKNPRGVIDRKPEFSAIFHRG